MLDLGLLELIIALASIYLVLGVVTSYVCNVIASWRRWRSQYVARKIRRMLGEDQQKAEKILMHSLVQDLVEKQGQIPLSIHPDVLTRVFVDLSNQSGQGGWIGIHNFITTLPEGSPARLTLQELWDKYPKGLSTPSNFWDDVRRWMMEEMNSISSVYSRRMDRIALIVAFVLTLLLGLDIFAMSNFFLQKTIINSALSQYYASISLTNPQELLTKTQSILPIGWGTLPTTAEDWLRKMIGLSISALAVALCAPLSYNLRQYINSRLVPPSSVAARVEELRKAKPGDVQEIAASQILLLNEYQNQVLSQQNRSFLYALVAAAIGLGFFLVAITFVLLQQKTDAALVSGLAGAIVEVISGINFYLYAQTSTQVALFHSRLDMTQRFLLANSVCETLSGNYKEEARSAIVHCLVASEPITQTSPKPKEEQTKIDTGKF